MPEQKLEKTLLRVGWVVVLTATLAVMAPSQKSVAQAEPPEPAYPRVQLYPLDPQAFPVIRTYLDVFENPSSFVHGLKAQEIWIRENEQLLPAAALTEIKPGVQLAVAVTYGPALGIRDGLGRSRYDYLLEGLSAWENSPMPDPPDDLNLILDAGPEAIHLTRPAQVLEMLQGFQIEPRQALPSLQPLSRAIEVVLDPSDRPQMKRVILFITPPQPTEAIAGLQSLTSQAIQAGIHVFVWLVSAPEEAATPASQQLARLAAQTGGGFFNYSGVEALPEINSILEPLRYTYELSYRSAVTSSGEYMVSVELDHAELTLVSEPQRLVMNLQPPNPVFIALPARIELSPVDPEHVQAGELSATTALPKPQPRQSQTLEVLVEFPDGYPRELTASELIVDGVVVDRNLEAPFDTFEWDLTPYTTNGQHQVQVVVTDTLGLSGSSLALPVEIIAEPVNPGLSANLGEHGLWLIGLLLMLVGAVIGLGMIFGGRLYPYRLGQRVMGGARTRLTSRRTDAPTLPYGGAAALAGKKPSEPRETSIHKTTASQSPEKAGWLRRIAQPTAKKRQQARAFLIPISEMDVPIDETPVPIPKGKTVLGSDPTQADWVLAHPAIDPVHARLQLDEDLILIFDEGSTAGTWVNYQPVPPSGCRLRHGDLVHIGSKPFRFKSLDAKDLRKPVIQSQEWLA